MVGEPGSVNIIDRCSERKKLATLTFENDASRPTLTLIEDGFLTRAMDSNGLERERGITLPALRTDTTGHADFGEVDG